MQVLVHGGAGREPDDATRRQAVLEEAIEAGTAASSPVAAVETAINRLESSPRFNAGVGSAVQSDGRIRTDAGIMTADRSVGAACSMPNIERAISVARVVLEETPHGLVSGDHAVSLARAFGVETGGDCWTDRTRDRWAERDLPGGDVRDDLAWIRDRYGRSASSDRDVERPVDETADEYTTDVDARDHDTVGAVAVDGDALAAGTSTGGRWFALAGRVGDVPQVGAGFYCSPAAAVSATGAGEDIARVTLSRRVAHLVDRGHDAAEAATLAIDEFADRTGSTAGVICLDARGTCGSAVTGGTMQTARTAT